MVILLLSLGGCSFELCVPFLIGYMVNTTALIHTTPPGITTDVHDERMLTIWIIMASALFVSCICQWIKTTILNIASQKMASNIRYDLYYNYQLKCLKVPNGKLIDKDE